jgi:hypothetical protein
MVTAVGEGLNIEFVRQGNGPLEALRNNITETALRTNCTHIIQCDADMQYPEETFPRLMALCNESRPIVGALCFRRYPPFTPVLMKGELGYYEPIWDWKKDELLEVDATGTGCLMVHASVFKAMPRPWFEFGEFEGRTVGEDIGFCAKARKLGFPIYVDTGLEVAHLTTMSITEGTYHLYKGLKKLREATGETNEFDTMDEI